MPLVLFLPEFRQLGVMGPLYSGPIADVVSFTAAMIMMAYVWKQLSVNRFGETVIHNELVLMKD